MPTGWRCSARRLLDFNGNLIEVVYRSQDFIVDVI